jgi:hypothetical protein
MYSFGFIQVHETKAIIAGGGTAEDMEGWQIKNANALEEKTKMKQVFLRQVPIIARNESLLSVR